QHAGFPFRWEADFVAESNLLPEGSRPTAGRSTCSHGSTQAGEASASASPAYLCRRSRPRTARGPVGAMTNQGTFQPEIFSSWLAKLPTLRARTDPSAGS